LLLLSRILYQTGDCNLIGIFSS